MADGQDPRMQQAYEAACRSFKFFWRELSWERQRIVPGLDFAAIKLPFTDGPRTDGRPAFEHMWVDNVDFDGVTLRGSLMNSPNWLRSIKSGDAVEAPFNNLTDWMISAAGRAYGGHTVNLMRARMSANERRNHDQAWGLDFGDPNEIRMELVPRVKKKPGLLSGLFTSKAKIPTAQSSFSEHPMGIEMLPKIEAQLKADPSIVRLADERGWTALHREAMAGNREIVALLLRYGSDARSITVTGETAAALARTIGWPEIAEDIEAAGHPAS